MQNLPANVLSYLSKHFVKNYTIEWQRKTAINNVIVIPAIAEYNNIKVLLKSLSENDPAFFPSSLILFVVNNSPVSDDEIKKDNLIITIPIYSERNNYYSDDENYPSKFKRLVGYINKRISQYGFGFWIDMGYTGKADQDTGMLWDIGGSQEEFEKFCKNNQIDIIIE